MNKITFINGKAPALNATNLNQLQTNVETAIAENTKNIGDLSNLETTEKTNLVSAINEAASSGGGSTDGWLSLSGSFSYGGYDSTTKTATIITNTSLSRVLSAGMKLKFTNSTIKYAIVTKVTSSIITIFMGTDYTLENSTISNAYYSYSKTPLDFPLNPDKWSLNFTSNSTNCGSISTNFSKTNFSITLPVGLFELSYCISIWAKGNGGETLIVKTAISNGNSTTAIADSTDFRDSGNGYTSVNKLGGIFKGSTIINSQTTVSYYILLAYASSVSNNSIEAYNYSIPTTIKATIKYL